MKIKVQILLTVLIFSIINLSFGGNSIFKADINGTSWEATNSYYNISGGRINIFAMNSNSDMLFLSFEGTTSDEYVPDTISYFFYNDEMYSIQTGSIKFDLFNNGVCNGYFSFEAVNQNKTTDKITATKGVFENVYNSGSSNNDVNSFSCTKEMKIDVNKGEINTTNTPVEITISEKEINFQYTSKKSKSFTVQIIKEEKSSTMSVYYTNKSEIEKITIDLINNYQTTIWYSDGNTTTYFK